MKKLIYLTPFFILILILLIFPSPKTEIIDSKVNTQQIEKINILSWNLGYAGLGSLEDFKVDGGTQWQVSSRDAAKKYSDEIIKIIHEIDAEIVLFQELAGPGFANKNVDLHSLINTAFPKKGYIFETEYRFRLPFGMGMETGIAIYSVGLNSKNTRMHHLPSGALINFGRNYPMLSYELEHQGQKITIFNLHLSAFDENATVRTTQIMEAFRIAENEYNKGRSVILAGDFNFEFKESPHWGSSSTSDMKWLVPFQWDLVPKNWKVGSGWSTPTFRSLDKAYISGQNYEGSIDGFIISPDLDGCVNVIDQGFSASDHNPVILSVQKGTEITTLKNDNRLYECK